MALVVESSAVTEVSATSGDPGSPTGLTIGDLVLLFAHIEGNVTPTWPTSFTQLYDDNDASGDDTNAAAYKIWASGDTTSVSWGASKKAIVGAVRISGAHATPIDVTSSENQGSSTVPQCPTATTTVANTLVFRAYACDDAQLGTEDTDYPTSHTGIYNRETSAANACSGGVAYEAQASIGATGTADWLLDGTEGWTARTFVIAPAAVAGAVLALAHIAAL